METKFKVRWPDALGLALGVVAVLLALRVYTRAEPGACMPSIREMPAQVRPVLT